MIKSEPTTHTCHFTVCGEGLTNLVRQMYCYEYKPLQAMDILDGLHGITLSQAKKVCTGQARLEDRNNDGLIYYVEKPDQQFIFTYTDHLVWLEQHLKDEAQELKNTIINLNTPRISRLDDEEIADLGRWCARKERELRDKSYMLGNRDFREPIEEGEREPSKYGSPHIDNVSRSGLLGKSLRATYPDVYAEPEPDMQSLEEMANTLTQSGIFGETPIPEPSKETVNVGKWDVPKNLIDRYALHVVKRIRKSILCREIPDSIEGVTELYNLEMERQGLHDAICNALGFDHDAKEPNEDQVNFDLALQEYLDKHAGSLFSGDE
jgi:hypothetical protein